MLQQTMKRQAKTKILPQIQVNELIGQIATNALIAEVSTTPKPGLIDRISSGAHSDMNYQTFIDSAKAISSYFIKMAEIGYQCEKSLPDLFEDIRIVGIQAEEAMFKATQGVNTHKGLIFSVGIISAASGHVYKRVNRFNVAMIFDVCSTMTYEILERDFEGIDPKNPKTNGERLYTLFGNKGIRGEVQNGFPSVREISLPALNKFLDCCENKNESYVQVLFLLMANVNDTNVLSRHDDETLCYVKEIARHVLSLGGAFTDIGKKTIVALDDIFIEKNISSGGCADLLAVTIMMSSLSRL